MPANDDEFEALIEQSSLGSEGARRLRRRTSRRQVDAVRRIAEEHERGSGDAAGPHPGARPSAARPAPDSPRQPGQPMPAGIGATAIATVTEDRSDVAVLHLRGELDADTAPQLQATLSQLLERPVPRIVVDLTALKFCDSVGLSALITSRQVILARGGWLRLAGANPFLAALLDTVGLSTYFPTFPSVAAALDA
ncbi:STAS domain-containing protein [Actinoplanes aureus]|nr:STAS domain-containing protein [Actinoplanes aureus]